MLRSLKNLKKNENNPDLKAFLNLKRGESELTVLHVAFGVVWKHYGEYRHTVNLFREAGADLDVQDIEGKTPLHYAASIGCRDVVGSLLANKANPNICDKQGKTPLQVAIDNHNYHIHRSFLTHPQEFFYEELSYIITEMGYPFEDELGCIVDLTQELKCFLDTSKNDPDLKVALSLRDPGGTLIVLRYAEAVYGFLDHASVDEEKKSLLKFEIKRLLCEAGATDLKELNYYRKEHLLKSGTLWSNLTLNQQKKLNEFLGKVSGLKI